MAKDPDTINEGKDRKEPAEDPRDESDQQENEQRQREDRGDTSRDEEWWRNEGNGRGEVY